MVAAVVIVGALVILLANPFANTMENASKDASSETTTQQDDAQATSEEPEPQEVSVDDGLICATLPAEYAEQGYEWVALNGELRLRNKDGLCAVIVYQGSFTLSYEEAQATSYKIGIVGTSASHQNVVAKVLHWQNTSQGLAAVHASEPASAGKESLGFMGTNIDAAAQWIYLEYDGELKHAYAPDMPMVDASASSSSSGSPSSSPSSSADSLVANHQPFYGVWIGAFESRSNAERYLADARSAGLDAHMLLSNEWTNLNQNPYWVVAGAVASTEEEANSLLATVQARGYSNAYVKYSGTYKG